eukprot:PhF_6_TR17084/c0_g1_i1/m.26227
MSKFDIFCLVFVSACFTTYAAFPPPGNTVFVRTTIAPPLTTGTQYLSGQEIRITLSMGYNAHRNVSFNSTAGGFAIRLISAFPDRSTSGTKAQLCNSTSLTTKSIWQTHRDVGASFFRWGRGITTQVAATFTVPPFPWRICMRFSKRGKSGDTFEEIPDQNYRYYLSNFSVAYWYATAPPITGQSGTLQIRTFDSSWDYPLTYPRSVDQATGDNVKLVPAGMPCTYEKSSSRDINRGRQHYCGTNQVNARGHWRTSDCILEGSVKGGVAVVGTTSLNPYVDTFNSGTVSTGSALLAYFTWPKDGSYDICYSSTQLRRNNVTVPSPAPVWMKLFQLGSSGCTLLTAHTTHRDCKPSIMRFTVSAPTVSDQVYWSMHDFTALSWGVLRFRRPDGGLNSQAATQWDCATCTKSYHTTAGGDVFRLIPISQVATSAAASSNSAIISVTGIASTYGVPSEQTEVKYAGMPSFGSMTTTPGCWYSAGDNYGSKGATIGGAVNTADGDTDLNGVTASGDLGSADPYTSKTAHLTSSSSSTTAYAYIRVPSTSTSYSVCYRRAGQYNWQTALWDPSMAMPNVPNTLIPSSTTLYNNVTYHINDTRALTFGEFTVSSRTRRFNTMPNRYYSPPSTIKWETLPSVITGVALKIVKTTESCWTDTATAENWDSGLPPCELSLCKTGVCTGCAGSLDSTSTLRKLVTFQLRIPVVPSSGYYRICFRIGAMNWVHLSDATYESRYGSTSTLRFVPAPAAALQVSMLDRREGTIAAVRVRQSIRNILNPALDARPNTPRAGDILRVVQNRTQGLDIPCDFVFGADDSVLARAQAYDPLLTDDNLGVWCVSSASATSTSSLCQTTTVVSSGGVLGNYPFTDINPSGDGKLENDLGTVGFIKLPLRNRGGFKVCYKQFGKNWIDLPLYPGSRSFVTTAQGTLGILFPDALYTGMTVRGTILPTFPRKFNPKYSTFKVVPGSKTCGATALGWSTLGNLYSSSTNSFDQVLLTDLNGNAGQDRLLDSGYVFLTLPTLRSSQFSTNQYTVCYFDSLSTANGNWEEAAKISVTHLGITYSVPAIPIHGSTQVISFSGNLSSPLNTTANGDRFKFVEGNQRCYSEGPSNTTNTMVASLHLGLELSGRLSSVQISGVADLGPSDLDQTVLSQISTTFPQSLTSTRYYTVCYKPYNKPWMAVEPSTSLFPDGLYSTSSTRTLTLDYRLFPRIPVPGRGSSNVSEILLPGVSTVLSSFMRSVQNITLSSIPTTTTYFAYLDSCVATDQLKFVQRTRVSGGDQWISNPSAQCDLDAYRGIIVRPNVTSCGVAVNIPAEAGEYLVCLRIGSSWTAIKIVYPNGTMISQPLSVAYPKVGFVPETSVLTVVDNWMQGLNSLGSLAYNDYVYIVNASDVCGFANPYMSSSTSVANELPYNVTQLNGTTPAYQLLASRLSTVANPPGNSSLPSFYPVLKTGVFKVCYFKQINATRVKDSANTVHFMQGGLWYQIPNFGSTNGGGSPYLDSSFPSGISVSCSINQTQILRPGDTFSATVFVVDNLGRRMPSVTTSYEINVVPVGSGSIQNSAGQCTLDQATRFGLNSDNGKQYTSNGQVTFALTPMTFCDQPICSVAFTSTVFPNSNPQCRYRVRSFPVTKLKLIQAPTTCGWNQKCPLTLSASSFDDRIEYSSNLPVTIVTSQHPGLRMTFTDSSNSRLLKGYFATVISPQVNSLPELWSDQATYVVNVTLIVGTLSLSTLIGVTRPKLQQVNVYDIYPVNVQGLPVNEDSTNLVPGWEPSLSHRGSHWEPRPSVVASSTHYLVAGVYYRVVLQAVLSDGTTSNIPPQWLSSTTITMISPSPNNLIIGPNFGVKNESYATPLQPTAFSDSRATLAFRLKNSDGCTNSTGGCKLVFKFNGTDLLQETSIQTVVRSRAVAVRVVCPTSDSCTTTTVERGFSWRVEAVDQFGKVDEYFDGQLAMHADGTSNVTFLNGATITTVDKLIRGDTRPISALSFSQGVLILPNLTLSKPCLSGCVLRLLTTWGTIESAIPIVVNPSSRSLRCRVSSSHHTVDFSTVGNQTIRKIGSLASTNTALNRLLVYFGNEVCVSVQAVTANDTLTLYETLWVTMRTLLTTGGNTPSANLQLVTTRGGRVQAMKSSSAEFCFIIPTPANTIISNVSVKLHFSAQRFGVNELGEDFWTRTNGDCLLEGITIRPDRSIKQMVVTGITGMQVPVRPQFAVPSTSPWYFFQHGVDSSAAIPIEISLEARDHYNNPITNPADLYAPHKSVYVTPERCDNSVLSAGTCNTGSGTDEYGKVFAEHIWSPVEGGRLSMTLGKYTNTITAGNPLKFSFTAYGWCIRSNITLTMKILDGDKGSANFINDDGSTVFVTVAFSVIMGTPVSQSIVFRKGSSPFAPPVGSTITPTLLISRPWQHFLFQNSSAILWNNPTTGNIIINSKCFLPNSNCFPPESVLLQPGCSPRGSSIISNNGKDLDVYVVNSVLQRPSSIKGNQFLDSDELSTQIDLLSRVLTIQIGPQSLRCVTGNCSLSSSGDLLLNIQPYGPNLTEAVFNIYNSYRSGPRTNGFQLESTRPSPFYSVWKQGVSIYRGVFTIKATGMTTLTTANLQDGTEFAGDYEFAWAGPQYVVSLVVENTLIQGGCRDAPTFVNSYVGPEHPIYDGYHKPRVLESLNVSYSLLPINVFNTIAVTLRSPNGDRVLFAAGRIVTTLHAWNGCNNGGSLTVRDAAALVDNGYATVAFKFSAPCQQCILRFEYISSSVSASMVSDAVGSIVGFSKPFDVRDIITRQATTVLVPENGATPPLPTVTLSDLITINVQAYTNWSNMALEDTAASGTVRVYSSYSDVTGRSTLWFGNGGVLRMDLQQPNYDRHAVLSPIAGGYGTITVAFQRRCLRCNLRVVWSLFDGVVKGSFIYRALDGSVDFRVRTPATRRVPAGYVPQVAWTGGYTLVFWHVADAEGLFGVGVGSTVLPVTATPTVLAQDTTNGDGGNIDFDNVLSDFSLPVDVWEIYVTVPCKSLVVRYSGISFSTNIVSPASQLTIVSITEVERGDSMRRWKAQLLAKSADGNIDLSFGGFDDCFVNVTFICQTSLISLGVNYDTQTTNFDSPNLHTGCRPGSIFVENITRPMRGGNAEIIFKMDQPCRNTTVYFTAGTLRSPSSITLQSTPSTGNISLSTTDTSYSTMVGFPLNIPVAVVRYHSFIGVKFVDGSATGNSFIVLDRACPPAIIPNASRVLRGGMTTFQIIFNALTNATCTINFTTDTPTCPKCTASVQVQVSSRVATQWRFLAPSSADNLGALPGLSYGAMGRRSLVVIQTYNTVNGLQNPVECPGCVVSLTLNCPVTPNIVTINPFNNTSTESTTVVLWPTTANRRPYSCYALVKVTAASGVPLSAPPNAESTVQVCSPAQVVMVTNTTLEYVNKLAFLSTGVTYNFTVASVDPYGAVCVGDSQADATTLTLDVVQPTSTLKSDVIAISTVGISHVAALSPAMIGGRYLFTLRFTKPSDGFRLRITGKASQPVLQSVCYTGVLQTDVAAISLRVSNGSVIPTDAITGRTVFRFVVWAVDDLTDPIWTSTIPNLPNIAVNLPTTNVRLMSLATDGVSINRDAVLTFLGATAADGSNALIKGVTEYSFIYGGPDATVCFAVVIREFSLLPTTPICSKFTKVVSLVETGESASYFIVQKDQVVIEPSSSFVIGVGFLSATGASIPAERGSILGIRLIKPSPNTNVVLRSSLSNDTTTFVNVTNAGRTRFFLSVLGTTLDTETDEHVPVRLEIFCATTIPNNPCTLYNVPSVFTRNFTVAVKKLTGIEKVSVVFSMPSVGKLTSDVAASLKRNILTALTANPSSSQYLTDSSSTNSNLQVLICSVDTNKYSQTDITLSSFGVCGVNNICGTEGDPSCPPQIVMCACPSSNATTSSTHRRLLQTNSNTTTIAEIAFDFGSTPGFTETQLAQANTVLAQSLISIVSSSAASPLSQYNINPSSIRQVITGVTTPATYKPLTLPTNAPKPTLSLVPPATLPPYDQDPNVIASKQRSHAQPMMSVWLIGWGLGLLTLALLG